MSYVLFVVGLLCLIKGGDWFVDGASALARNFGLPELLVGATVVSIGTTLPEVMVSTMSALSGHGEIAYGNAIGSVICNTALIAAITIAVRPGPVNVRALRVPVSFFYVAAAVYCLAAYVIGKFTLFPQKTPASAGGEMNAVLAGVTIADYCCIREYPDVKTT